ncbi:MAG TPA: type IX secretion system membrane protein PorP/SprF [Bacteroidales bacterium]|jgi:hypothetical protein|nr:type IX secretion system membrane protein PorP/SprF [Bacteroidales bacterium]
MRGKLTDESLHAVKTKQRFIGLLFPFFCCAFTVQAQWDASCNQYWATRGFSNPSFAGETETVRATAFYRKPWSGLSIDMPFEFLGRRHGIGLITQVEKAETAGTSDMIGTTGKSGGLGTSRRTGAPRNTLMAAQYSFKQKVGKGFLNVGLQAGLYEVAFISGDRTGISTSLSSIQGVDQSAWGDKKLFDAGAGASWTAPSFFIGFSLLHINQPKLQTYNQEVTPGSASDLPQPSDLNQPSDLPQPSSEANDSPVSRIPRTYNLMAGYNIQWLQPLEIQPMVWLRNSSGKTTVDATLRLEYVKKFSAGASWRIDQGYVIFAGITIKGVEVGYAYGRYTKGLENDNRGSTGLEGKTGINVGTGSEGITENLTKGTGNKGNHELYLRYHFPLEAFKPKRQPHKSIRLL